MLDYPFLLSLFILNINDDQFIRKNFIKLEKNQNTHYYEDAQLELAQPKKNLFLFVCIFTSQLNASCTSNYDSSLNFLVELKILYHFWAIPKKNYNYIVPKLNLLACSIYVLVKIQDETTHFLSMYCFNSFMSPDMSHISINERVPRQIRQAQWLRHTLQRIAPWYLKSI